jgi:hypothetical protein
MNTNKILALFKSELAVINLGLESFADNLRKEGVKVVQPEWKPAAGGDPAVQEALDRCLGPEGEPLAVIAAANLEAVGRILKAKPMIIGVGKALDTIPGYKKNLILHSGPPVTWDRMSGPTRGAVIGALIYEGFATNEAEAVKVAASDAIEYAPCHHYAAVGPMAGIVSASMPVWVLRNEAFGNLAYSTLNEGLGRVLRYGAFGDDVIQRLRWMESSLAPILSEVLAVTGPIDLRSIITQALQMGDEVHNRNRAATSLLIRTLAPHLVTLKRTPEEIAAVLRFLDGNDHFFLNLSMAASKCSLAPAEGLKHCSLITIQARNGTDFGIQVSALPGRWFTAPAPMVDGLYLPGYTAEDAAPDIGDSVITETNGLGGFAMAAAPAIVQFVGGTAPMALDVTRRMYEITTAEHPQYKIPALDFRGTPTGIDLLKILDRNILPVVNTGIAHKQPGVGMVGAGLVKPPLECYQKALTAFANEAL